MTFSSLPSSAEEVGMRKLRLDVRLELFAGIDSDLDGSDTSIVLGEGNQTSISTDGKIRSVAVFSSDHEVLMFAVNVIGLRARLTYTNPRSGTSPPRGT